MARIWPSAVDAERERALQQAAAGDGAAGSGAVGARQRVGDRDDAVFDGVGNVERRADQREAGRSDEEDVLVGALGEAAGDHRLAR